MLKYTITGENDDVQVSLVGDLDIEGTEIINDELIPDLISSDVVNVNLEHVPFVDSSGMGLLMNIVHKLKENDTLITISNVREEVFEVLEMLQIPEIVGKEVFI